MPEAGTEGALVGARTEARKTRSNAADRTSLYRASAAADPPAQKDTEINVNASQNMKSGSSIEQQLSSVNMSQYERNAVLHDLSIAELFVDAIVLVRGKFTRPSGDVFATPSPKH